MPLEDDVLDSALGQGVAGDQASLATTDHDGVVNLGHQEHRPRGAASFAGVMCAGHTWWHAR
jgi:hypothetical protein